MSARRKGDAPPSPVHPLCYGVDLPHGRTLPVLGVAVSFRSNDPELLAAATAPFDCWGRYDGPMTSADDPLKVELVAHEVADAAAEGPVTYRLPDRERVVMSGPGGSLGISDARRRQVVAYTGRNPRTGFASGLVLSLLAHEDRFPVHAGAVAHGNAALLLLGPSGTGKSTLSYAFMEAGGAVLSDDSVFVQRGGRGGVWGTPGDVHLLSEAEAFFPHLSELEAEPLPNGKKKIRVEIAGSARPDRFVYRRYGLCLLRRNGDAHAPRLEPLRPEELEEELRRRPRERLDAFADEAADVLRELARHRPAWCLDLGGPPQASVPCLEAALEAVDAASDP